VVAVAVMVVDSHSNLPHLQRRLGLILMLSVPLWLLYLHNKRLHLRFNKKQAF
jgi:hypothetical protein